MPAPVPALSSRADCTRSAPTLAYFLSRHLQAGRRGLFMCVLHHTYLAIPLISADARPLWQRLDRNQRTSDGVVRFVSQRGLRRGQPSCVPGNRKYAVYTR